MFEILHGTLVLFGCRARRESTEVAALACLGIELPRVQAVLAVLELADHDFWLARPLPKRGAGRGGGPAGEP